MILYLFCSSIFTLVSGNFWVMLYTSSENDVFFFQLTRVVSFFFCTVWFWLMAFKGSIEYAWKERGEGSQAARRKSAPAQPTSRLLRRGNSCHKCRKSPMRINNAFFIASWFWNYLTMELWCALHSCLLCCIIILASVIRVTWVIFFLYECIDCRVYTTSHTNLDV